MKYTNNKRRKYKKSLTKYRRKRRTYKGGNELISKIQQIYRYINIHNADGENVGLIPNYIIHIPNMFDYRNKSIGGNVTYKLPHGESITSESMKRYKFDSNRSGISSTLPNFIIIGGGPVGLYMSILLKLLLSHKVNVYVLESRHIDGKRELTRCQIITLNKFISTMQFLNMDFGFDTVLFQKFIENIPIHLHQYFVYNPHETPEFSFIRFLYDTMDAEIVINERMNTLPLNILEYKLANYAQKIGVNIIHTEPITFTNLDNYVNEQTKVVFDATGGKFRNTRTHLRSKQQQYYSYCGNNMCKDISKPRNYYFTGDYSDILLISQYGEILYSKTSYDEGTTVIPVFTGGNQITISIPSNKSGPFDILCGSLHPNDAITIFNPTYIIQYIPIVSIGDSYMKTDFRFGYGLYYGFMVSFLIAIEIYESVNRTFR
jgi:hypothetical protein